MNPKSLRGQVAVVTGASSGIGAAVARALAREGVHVALTARREDALLEVQAGLNHRGGEVRSLIAATDVADRDQVKSLVARTEEELGPVDVLVNCAGSCTTPGCSTLDTQHSTLRFRALLADGRQEVRLERVAEDRMLRD